MESLVLCFETGPFDIVQKSQNSKGFLLTLSVGFFIIPIIYNFYTVKFERFSLQHGYWVGTVLLSSCELIERPSKKDGFCFKLFHPLDQSIWAVRVIHLEFALQS